MKTPHAKHETPHAKHDPTVAAVVKFRVGVKLQVPVTYSPRKIWVIGTQKCYSRQFLAETNEFGRQQCSNNCFTIGLVSLDNLVGANITSKLAQLNYIFMEKDQAFLNKAL